MIDKLRQETTVAVVDDEESIREGCRQLFELEGYRTHVAADGEQAVRMVDETRPAVVLVDLKMPGMSGVEVVRKIREIDPLIVPVIITGYGTIPSAVEAMGCGACDYLMKPCDDKALLSAVTRALEVHRARRRSLENEERQEAALSNYAAVVCHEIKSPVAAAAQWMEVMKAGIAGPLTPRQSKILERACNRIDDSTRMIDRWMTLGRIEAGRASLEPTTVELEQVVGSAWAAVCEEEKAHDVEFRLVGSEKTASVSGDAGLLEEAVANLLRNAVRHSQKAAKITVRLTADETARTVSVTDTGPGIGEDELPHLFKPFYRGTRSDTKGKGGNGLGLAIVDKIARLHGGSVSVTSRVGHGTTFKLTFPGTPGALPALPPEPEAEAAQPEPAPAALNLGLFSPSEVAQNVVTTSKAKCGLSVAQMTILGVLAGVYIGFGAQLYTMVTHDLALYTGVGFAKFIGGSVFSVGLMLVILAGAELFTGNNLILAGVLAGECTTRSMVRNWSVVYAANMLGSLILVGIMYASGLWKTGALAVGASAVNTALAKMSLSFTEAFFRGVGCNWLVCLAVWMAFAGKDAVSRILGIYFPIMAFVASGFEHSVANMYFIPMGILLKGTAAVPAGTATASLTWTGFALGNLLPVTLGNIVGGAVFVAGMYHFAYRRSWKLAQRTVSESRATKRKG